MSQRNKQIHQLYKQLLKKKERNRTEQKRNVKIMTTTAIIIKLPQLSPQTFSLSLSLHRQHRHLQTIIIISKTIIILIIMIVVIRDE